ncbi:hypothetical protein BJ138DRAFT_569843 [Hygrophoropsis aurantiaca]|uniref:Uncharacterized protein n=1 Tax=Hygrophoropsis aurantiaca TaxID=72124 RepID=A0ACB8ALR6_9AGAM|nr:hypothetical protein BJ138DRAFT_569843 [Hygrophoropsis aurantiaca]
MLMFKSTRLVIFASIISSAAANSICGFPHPSFESRLYLAIYSETGCKSLINTDHEVFTEWGLLAEGFKLHKCQCVPFSSLVSTASYVFQSGDYTEATLELWTGKNCNEHSYRQTLPGQDIYEDAVNPEYKLHSATICIGHEPKKPSEKSSKKPSKKRPGDKKLGDKLADAGWWIVEGGKALADGLAEGSADVVDSDVGEGVATAFELAA